MQHYKNFHNRIAEINDSIIYHTFCSKQINIEIELFKKNYNGTKEINKVTNRQIFKKNEHSNRFNKKIEEITEVINKSDSFFYDNSLILIYLQLEVFVREYYSSIKKIEKFFREKNVKIQLDDFMLIKSNNIDKLDQKLNNLRESYIKNGINLTFHKKEKERLNTNDTPLLIDINTNQITTSVLKNIGVINDNNEISKFWKKIIDGKNIPIHLYIDTLEYFRLRRNAITHRELKNRSNGSFGLFISEKGKELNKGWDEIKSQKDRYINFEQLEFLVFSNHLEVIESINIFRKITDNLDYLFSNVYSKKELVLYFFDSFQEERRLKNKGNFNLSINFDRFYSKFVGYLNDNFIKLELSKELVHTCLIEIGK